MINSLQSLRGIFAVLIFLSHFVVDSDGGRAFYPGGTSGVEYFIVLSGFVMCAGYESAICRSAISWREFMTRRLVRIYPLHMLCLLAWMMSQIGIRDIDGYAVAANSVLLQAWVPDYHIFYGCNTPSWCLSVFLFLYALYPSIIKAYDSDSRRFVAVFFGVWVLYGAYLCWLPTGLDDEDNMEIWASRIFPPLRLIDFTLGILLWKLYKKLRTGRFAERLRLMSVVGKTCVELVPLGLYGIGVAAADVLAVKWCSEAIWWLPVMSIVMVFGLMDRSGGLITRILNTRALVCFGNASFCFYLIHLLSIRAVDRFFNHFAWSMPVAVMLPLALAITVVASLAVYRYVDMPLGDRLKRLFLGR